MSIFVDSFSLEAATALCAGAPATEAYITRGLQIYWPSAECPDAQSVSRHVQRPNQVAQSIFEGVTSLVNKSLVKCLPQSEGEPRFVLLETMRAYGVEQLEAQGELQAAQRAHAGYYLLLAVEAQPYLHGPEESAWLEQLTLEHHNLHAALDWAVAQQIVPLAMRLGEALFAYWHRTSYRYAALERLQGIAALADNAPPSFACSRFFFDLALATEGRHGKSAAAALYERSLAISRAAGDNFTLGNCLNKLGGLAYRRGDYATWEACLQEAEPLKLEAGGHYIHALVMGFTGRELIQLGRFAEGRALCEQALALHRELGDKWGLCIVLHSFSQAALLQGDVARAEELAQECLEIAQALNADHLIADAQTKLGRVALARADYPRAQTLLRAALQTDQPHQSYHAQVES
ncbi:MAG: tetratricopeptide repeat protein [Caldilineaceae bacterium]